MENKNNKKMKTIEQELKELEWRLMHIAREKQLCIEDELIIYEAIQILKWTISKQEKK